MWRRVPQTNQQFGFGLYSMARQYPDAHDWSAICSPAAPNKQCAQDLRIRNFRHVEAVRQLQPQTSVPFYMVRVRLEMADVTHKLWGLCQKSDPLV